MYSSLGAGDRPCRSGLFGVLIDDTPSFRWLKDLRELLSSEAPVGLAQLDEAAASRRTAVTSGP